MTKRIKIIFMAAIAVPAILIAGILLYRHFITDRIKDKGGMENPDYMNGLENAGEALPPFASHPLEFYINCEIYPPLEPLPQLPLIPYAQEV